MAEVRSIAIAMAEKPAAIPEASKKVSDGKAPKEAAPAGTTAISGAATAVLATVAGAGGDLTWWQIGLLAAAAFIAVVAAIHFISKRD